MSNSLAVVTKHMRQVYQASQFGGHVVLMGSVSHVNASAFIDEVRVVLVDELSGNGGAWT
jgi:hypothetical protein